MQYHDALISAVTLNEAVRELRAHGLEVRVNGRIIEALDSTWVLVAEADEDFLVEGYLILEFLGY